jgi:hypothetical protein
MTALVTEFKKKYQNFCEYVAMIPPIYGLQTGLFPVHAIRNQLKLSKKLWTGNVTIKLKLNK